MIFLKKPFCSLLFYLIADLSIATAQTKQEFSANNLGFQYGVSGKALIEFALKKHTQKPVFRFCLNAGVGSGFLSPDIHPSFNLEMQLYNGGLGSQRRQGFTKPAFTLDVITAFTLTAGFKDHFTAQQAGLLTSRNIPLYYFADFVYPALQNPFSYSLSAGTNFIFSTDHNKSNQRVGFLNGHFGRLQVSYYNDGGTPIHDMNLGDRKDRYYTGGTVISYHAKSYTVINLIELSYHKFTGYSKNAFEVSNKLDLAYVNYKKPEQKYYNKSMWGINIANPAKGLGVNIRMYNKTNLDLQHIIHWGLFNAFHLVPYGDFFSVNVSYYCRYNNIGLK